MSGSNLTRLQPALEIHKPDGRINTRLKASPSLFLCNTTVLPVTVLSRLPVFVSSRQTAVTAHGNSSSQNKRFAEGGAKWAKMQSELSFFASLYFSDYVCKKLGICAN